MRYRIVLVLWLLAMLFPLALIGRISTESKLFIDRLLEPEWLHVVMHLLIYAGLAVLLSAALHRQGRRLSPITLILVILAVTTAQEFFQNAFSLTWGGLRNAVRASAFDLAVNLTGGLASLAAISLLTQPSKRTNNPASD